MCACAAGKDALSPLKVGETFRPADGYNEGAVCADSSVEQIASRGARQTGGSVRELAKRVSITRRRKGVWRATLATSSGSATASRGDLEGVVDN